MINHISLAKYRQNLTLLQGHLNNQLEQLRSKLANRDNLTAQRQERYDSYAEKAQKLLKKVSRVTNQYNEVNVNKIKLVKQINQNKFNELKSIYSEVVNFEENLHQETSPLGQINAAVLDNIKRDIDSFNNIRNLITKTKSEIHHKNLANSSHLRLLEFENRAALENNILSDNMLNENAKNILKNCYHNRNAYAFRKDINTVVIPIFHSNVTNNMGDSDFKNLKQVQKVFGNSQHDTGVHCINGKIDIQGNNQHGGETSVYYLKLNGAVRFKASHVYECTLQDKHIVFAYYDKTYANHDMAYNNDNKVCVPHKVNMNVGNDIELSGIIDVLFDPI